MFTEEMKKEGEILKLATRRRVYNTVQRCAGCHFRELQRRCKLPHGVVKYHLDYLSRHKIIRQEKLGNNVRYFPRNLPSQEERLLGLLRSPTSRQIIIFMCAKRKVGHKDIVNFVGLSPPTVSWHIKRLVDSGIVEPCGSGGKTGYSLRIERGQVIKLLITYRKSFLDSLVDRTVEMWG